MANPRRAFPLNQQWNDWALAGTLALKHGSAESFRSFIETTMAVTVAGMLRAGVRPASHPTSTSKE